MSIKKEMKTIFIFITILFMSIFSFHSEVYCDEEISEYTTKSGISINLPSEFTSFAVWNQMDENAQGISNMGFPDYNTAISALEKDGIEFLTYRDDINQDGGYAIRISYYDAPSDLTSQNLINVFIENNEDICTSLDETNALGYGNVQIDGIDFFKIYLETNGSQEKLYAYLFATQDEKLHEIVFRNHSVVEDIPYLDEMASLAADTIFLSDDLMNNLIEWDCNAFSTKKGEHESLFSFEEAISEGEEYEELVSNEQTATKNTTPYTKFISFEFPMLIIVAVLAVILICGIKVSKIGEWQEKPLSLENSKAIQGFAALAIIIHHLSQELATKAGALTLFSELGVLFVGVFFFFSGYGLYTSLKTKENYLKGFLKKRLVTILVPFYICILVFVLCACLKGESFSPLQLLSTLSGWYLINTHMWYIVEIAVLYLAFFIIYSLIKNRKVATGVLTLSVIVLTIGSLLLGHGADYACKYWFMGEWWYNTTLTFILGVLISQNEEKISHIARKFYALLLPLFAALTYVFYRLTNYALNTWSYWNEYPGYPGYKEKFLCLSVQLPWVIFFVITLILIMMKVKFSNPILKFLGSISLELYLIHNLFLAGLHDGTIMKVKSASMYVALTILLSIGLAALLHGLDKYIIDLINKKIDQKNEETKRIHSIDTLRIIMAFLVVTIHIPFNGTAGNIFITYGKIAVPFFLIVCGYFLYRNNSEEMAPRLRKQAIRILILYIGSNVLYYFANVLSASLDGFSVYFTKKQYIDLLLYNMSPFSEHLWFLGSLFYALVILMLLNKFKTINYVMFISPILIATYVILSHLGIGQAYELRNVILVGLPYTMMGMMIRRYQDKLMKIKTPILWVLALVLCITAIIELNTYKLGVGVPFVSCEILVYVVVLLCLKYPNFGKDTLAEKMGVELSLPIYILHVLLIMFITRIISSNVGLLSNYGAITVFSITAIFAALYSLIKKLIKNKIVKKA